jgi:hypothetical protein
MSTGSGRWPAGSKFAWLLRGASFLSCLPFSARSAGVSRLIDVSS